MFVLKISSIQKLLSFYKNLCLGNQYNTIVFSTIIKSYIKEHQLQISTKQICSFSSVFEKREKESPTLSL